MSGNLTDPKNLAMLMGNAPNEAWTRVGQVIAMVSVFSLLGIGFVGVEMGETSKYAPYVTMLAGFFSMYYGGRLRKNLQKAEREYELEKRRRDRPKPEPTRGNVEFLSWFKQQDQPMTIVELSRAAFAYDDKRDEEDVRAALRYSRAEFWVNIGNIKKSGDMYEIRTQT